MQHFRVSEKIADYLMSTFTFRLHGFTVVFDVQVRDVYLNGKALTSDRSAPLLVCDGDRVLCGIALDYDAAVCFNSDMQGIPYAQFFNTGNALPIGSEDESWLDCIPEEALENLLASLNRIMIPQALREHCQQVYRLSTLLPEEVLPSLKGNCCETLRARYLIGGHGFPTTYGCAHGLFMRWGTDPAGNRFSQLQVSQGAAEAFQKAVEPHRKKKSKLSLADRKQQLTRTSDGREQAVSLTLQNLQGMSIRMLLQGKKEALQNLSKVLPICRNLLSDEELPDADPTYGQLLQILQRLREGFGEDPAMDDWNSARKRRTSESILLALAEGFMPRKAVQTAETKAVPASKQSLRQRLQHVSLDTEQLANTPLCAYYQALSDLTDSSYPNWVYKTQIRPLIENQEKPESAYTLRFLAAYCQLSYEDMRVDNWKETFPLLYCLLLPECFS